MLQAIAVLSYSHVIFTMWMDGIKNGSVQLYIFYFKNTTTILKCIKNLSKNVGFILYPKPLNLQLNY